MPGDWWQKFANLRLLLGYMWSQPGKKLLFMGVELGQWREWNHDTALDWDLLDLPIHAGVRRWLEDLNRCYRDEPALHRRDWDPEGFQWVISQDSEQSVLAYCRRGAETDPEILVAANFTPVPRYDYRLGAPRGGYWKEVLNSDATIYAGSNVGNAGQVAASGEPSHGQPYSLSLQLPPLGIVFLRSEGDGPTTI
jgi:1,4-alpha-glucan branching enzyme